MSDAEKSTERLASEVDPTSTITSPRARPALAAGESWNTSWTSRPWDSTLMSIPIPLRCGLSWFWKLR